MKRRLSRLCLCLLAVLPLSGCVWLQNEFFVYDKPAPSVVPEPDAAAALPW